jgi:hypothetical protein
VDNFATNKISSLLVNGDGTFQPARPEVQPDAE